MFDHDAAVVAGDILTETLNGATCLIDTGENPRDIGFGNREVVVAGGVGDLDLSVLYYIATTASTNSLLLAAIASTKALSSFGVW